MKNSLNNDNKLFADYCRTIKIGSNKMQRGGGQRGGRGIAVGGRGGRAAGSKGWTTEEIIR